MRVSTRTAIGAALLPLIVVGGLLAVVVWDAVTWPKTGTVAAKRHDPERSTSKVVPILGDEHDAVAIVPHVEPESWFLQVRGDGDNPRTVWVQVTRELWSAVSVGSHWHAGMTEEDVVR